MTLKKHYYIWSNLFIYWALIAIRIKAQDNQHDRGIGVRQAIPRFALFTANPAIVRQQQTTFLKTCKYLQIKQISQIQLNG